MIIKVIVLQPISTLRLEISRLEIEIGQHVTDFYQWVIHHSYVLSVSFVKVPEFLHAYTAPSHNNNKLAQIDNIVPCISEKSFLEMDLLL